MNELVAGGGSYMLPALFGIAVVFFCVVVFIAMRTAVRANEQIALLEALLKEQKRQTNALKHLIELSSEPIVETVPEAVEEEAEKESDYLKFTAER